MNQLDTKRNQIFDTYQDGSFIDRNYFMDSLIYMRIVKGYYTSITHVINGVSIIFIKDYRKEMFNYKNE